MTDWLRVAERETTTEHAGEFEPIARGPLFAMIALLPLGALAACCLVWRKVAHSLASARPGTR
jgi:hypothetical protein